MYIYFFSKLHNLLPFCVHYIKIFSIQGLSENEIAGGGGGGEIRKITFDVDRVQEYTGMSMLSPSPNRKQAKLNVA